MKNFAVLLTNYNRKQETIICLDSFYKATNYSGNYTFDIYLVDDGSTDGTMASVYDLFPAVNIIKGNGSLYWAGGMRLAWKTAMAHNQNYDAYLLLNNDVVLFEDFIEKILKTHIYCQKEYHRPGIYICSTQDPESGAFTYGGSVILSKRIRVKKKAVMPGDAPRRCNMANSNIMVVTREVVKEIGIFDSFFIHGLADFDYTLRADAKGIPVLICPGYGGTCINDHDNPWLTIKHSLKNRINYLYDAKGLEFHQRSYYFKKHFKYQWPYYFVMLWLKTLFPLIWDKFKKNNIL